jgi:hypothetical protein
MNPGELGLLRFITRNMTPIKYTRRRVAIKVTSSNSNHSDEVFKRELKILRELPVPRLQRHDSSIASDDNSFREQNKYPRKSSKYSYLQLSSSDLKQFSDPGSSVWAIRHCCSMYYHNNYYLAANATAAAAAATTNQLINNP